MEHSFDIDIAKEYGIEEAILLNHFQFWIAKNKANNQNFYDGYYWTFNSMKALADLFPYMNNRKIDYAIENLIKNGLIIKGNYNKKGFDRTLWYAITNKGYAILQKCEMEDTKLLNGINKIVEPIPYNKTKILNTNKENIKEKEIFDFWNEKDIIKHKDIKPHLKAIQKALKEYSVEQIKEYIDRYNKVIKDKNYFFDYKWTLTDFLNRKDGISSFADDGSKWVNYLQGGNNYQKPAEKPQLMQHEYTQQDFDGIFDDLDKVVLK